MIRLLTLCVLSLVVIGCTNPSEKKISEIIPKETPHDFMFMQRAYPTGEIRTDAYALASAWKREQLQRNPSATPWEFAGPTNIGGRVTDIEIPVDQGLTYYVGTASGGIFKTTDAGANWIPIFDEQQMLSIGDMEISKNDTNIIWVGTGEVNAGGGSLAYDGDGIYRSGDGGVTWETKGLPDVGSIGKVLIDPNDENTIFVAGMGPLFRDDTNRGVYRSTDGGDTWDQILFISDITGVIDMAIHPTNGDIVYAASWERIRRPAFRQYGGATSGLYRSLDGGDTWAEMTSGLPTNPSDKGRISIDISQSNPNVLYARYADAIGSIEGVYRTANGGDTWTEVNSSQLTNIGFHWWFRGIFVDPNDENTIYNVDFVVEKSTDGGNNWSTTFPSVHVDQHAMAFNASVSGEVLLGNDGGFYKSINDGSSSVKDNTLPITQFYRFYVDPQNGDKIYGGTQDNGTIRTTTGSLNDWNLIFGGDGFQPLVDADNTNVIYAMSQVGNFAKSVNDGVSFSTLGGFGGRKNWNTPVTLDPNDSQTVYYGANIVYRSTNAGGNFSIISPDLTNNTGAGQSFETITTISVSRFDSNRVYVGTDDGNVWVTPDGGTTWNSISAVLPDRWVTSVYASPVDSDVVYVTLSGYRYGEDNGHVYKSENAGTSWEDISANLPDIPVNDILMDRFGNLYLATDIGVLAKRPAGTNWQVLGDNMPSVVVTDMHIHEGDELLYAATYGRSAYKLDLSENPLSTETSELDSAVKVYPNPASEYVNISMGDNYETIDIGLFDTMGRLVSEASYSEETKIRLNISSNASGVYYLKISNGAASTVKKIIIK